MKTLIVSYIPRGERSKTKKLVDKFIEKTKGHEVEHLDLIKDVPDMFLSDNLMAYLKRDYGGEKLSDSEAQLLAKMDRMTEQFRNADIVVVAFPMYNFSMPAIVKAYFDSILQKGKTWDIGENGYIGLMKGKKALILISSGGIYEEDMASFEHAMSLTKNIFQFTGFDDVRGVSAAGVNMMRDKVDEIVEKAQEEVSNIVDEWY